MNGLYATIGLIAIVGLAIWLYGRSQRVRGELKARARQSAKDAEDQRKMGKIMAQPRDSDLTSERLRDGEF